MAQQHILQVSELTKKVRFILESELNYVWLSGEISNFVAASSGHWYLSLKDQKSQVKCAMFKGNNRRVRLQPKNGQQVLVKAKVSLYEPRGDFQLIIELMEEAGEGLLRQQYEQLKQRLNAEGLFALQHKKLLPATPTTIGVVTSPSGAAVKDIISVLKRRNPAIAIIIYPALVQGEQAKQEIVSAISLANQRNECDVLIVGRGGGSLEDLWSFNEETVVKAIFNSTIPVISAVGHEIDTTLSDYVADVRAATPSAAAELVSQDSSELRQRFSRLNHQLQQQAQRTLNNAKQGALYLSHRLHQAHPEQILRNHQQRADELSLRLTKAILLKTQLAGFPLKQLAQRLQTASPNTKLQQLMMQRQQLDKQLASAANNYLTHQQERFVHLIEQLQLVSPLATIARGYSVSRNQQGKIINSIKDVTVNEQISVQLSDGRIHAQVAAKEQLSGTLTDS
ncbi:exodeoxyribonuclease 7 large subunit [Thalassotalea insulae]|uniref:Exodeoxyribonuclease 7 large subunit n=1 Tax=Thalassotalea insulae TaxID=2056778 RepID=A0ABQ6GVM0_9GAMM|nr:exodeoxyribonuclease VII large subunit [Thalassotalea insulae]GLX79399.1 exodeoxyribonuclease 7 large subunit [Thalassotalea insulae]